MRKHKLIKRDCDCGCRWVVHTHFSDYNYCGQCGCRGYKRSLRRRVDNLLRHSMFAKAPNDRLPT